MCINVYFKTFSGGGEGGRTEVLVACYILLSLPLEFFSSAPGKGLCEGLLTERFTTTRNLTCEREQMFLTIFTGTLVIQCLSHSAVKLSLVKFILSTNHGSVEKSL